MKIHFNNKGFTLIEIMVVVAVIAILAAIAIPSYLGIQRKSARSEAKANLEAISLALEGYMAETNNYGPGSTYTYVGTNFGHPGNIERTASLGNSNQLLYRYRVSTTQLPVPAFTIFATPVTGLGQEGDFRIFLTSNGDKWMELDNNGVNNPPGDPVW